MRKQQDRTLITCGITVILYSILVQLLNMGRLLFTYWEDGQSLDETYSYLNLFLCFVLISILIGGILLLIRGKRLEFTKPGLLAGAALVFCLGAASILLWSESQTEPWNYFQYTAVIFLQGVIYLLGAIHLLKKLVVAAPVCVLLLAMSGWVIYSYTVALPTGNQLDHIFPSVFQMMSMWGIAIFLIGEGFAILVYAIKERKILDSEEEGEL